MKPQPGFGMPSLSAAGTLFLSPFTRQGISFSTELKLRPFSGGYKQRAKYALFLWRYIRFLGIIIRAWRLHWRAGGKIMI